jgi:hypothetical protein
LAPLPALTSVARATAAVSCFRRDLSCVPFEDAGRPDSPMAVPYVPSTTTTTPAPTTTTTTPPPTCPPVVVCPTTPFPTRPPRPDCPWLTATLSDRIMECYEGRCDVTRSGWDCCHINGGRKQCPRSKPIMCNARACSGDFCCDTVADGCARYGGPRGCGGA